MIESKIIGVDFDGTCVTHEFPNVGKSIGAEVILKSLVDAGHKLILFTMRSDNQYSGVINGVDNTVLPITVLEDAVNWFKNNDIPLYGVNENPDQSTWTNSPKPYCHLYIDDVGCGIPLAFDEDVSDRAFVDWSAVSEILIEKGYLKNDI